MIQIPDFTSKDQVKDFDRALEEFKNTKTLILDVRNNSGGDTAFAKPMLGRLISSKQAYAWMGRVKNGQLIGSSEEFIEPRGPWTYSGRVLVLINRFSVSMAEGFAMSLQGIKRAELVGSEAAGLGAAIERYELPFSKIGWQISREPIYQLNGVPRELLRPDHPVEEEADEDAILKAAMGLAG